MVREDVRQAERGEREMESGRRGVCESDRGVGEGNAERERKGVKKRQMRERI